MQAFDHAEAVAINEARINHFTSLDLAVSGKTVLETGCGGRGDFTKHLTEKGAKVTLLDAREGNIQSLLQKTGLDLPYMVWDLNHEPSYFDKFDIVFSFGTLYHLENYSTGIKSFSKWCKELLILETAIAPTPDEVSFVNGRGDEAQAVTDTECRLGQNVVVEEVKKHFKHVYLTTNQPVEKRLFLLASRSPLKTDFRWEEM